MILVFIGVHRVKEIASVGRGRWVSPSNQLLHLIVVGAVGSVFQESMPRRLTRKC